MSDVITIPITASKIKEQFAYYVDEPKFDLQRYRGMVIAYPDYWRDINGNIIPDSNGDPQYLRRLPTSGRLRFSDFLGAAGYFVPYPSPTITQTRLLTTVTGNSNVGSTTHTASFSVDANNHNVVPWRPDITSVVITGQWQLKAPGSSSFVSTGSAESHTVGPKGSATFTRTDANGDLGVYEWRLIITATSYAPNDDAVPSGGSLGADRSVGSSSLTSNVGRTELEAYDPPDSEIVLVTGSWNEAPDNSPYVGHYAIATRTIDGFIVSKPSPVLSFGGGSLYTATFSDAPGREPINESTAIEWQFKDLQNPLQTDWLPVSELAFDYEGSAYPDNNLYGGMWTNYGIQLTNLDDIRFDGMEFRCKVTATQELSSPAETKVVEVYTPVYSLDVSIADIPPSYLLTGTSAVVNGGTFNFEFTPLNTGSRAYNYSINDPQGDFVSGDTTGTFTVDSSETANFSARTILDTDTVTEFFTLNVYDTLDNEVVATKALNIIYGEQDWYFKSIDQTISEQDSVTLHFGADNVGDSLVEIKYERIVTDATGANDFTLVDGTNWPAGNWLVFDVDTDLDQSSDSVIKSVGSLSAIAIKDSAFGGAIDNLEKFRFYLRNPGGSTKDNVDVTVLDKLNFQVDLFGGLGSRSATYSVTATAASQDVTPIPRVSLDWANDPKWHISMADKTYRRLEYKFQYYHPQAVPNWSDFGAGFYWDTFGTNYPNGFALAYLDGTSEGDSYIMAMPGPRLDFTNIHAETYNDRPLTEYRWRVAVRVEATDGSRTAWKYTSAGRITITEDYNYIRTGVKYVTCDAMTEGTLEPVTVRVRTSSSIGRSCTVTLSDPERTGYLIDFPKFGPIPPHPRPQNPVSGTITSNTTVFYMGAWLYHSYGYTQNLPTFTNPVSKKYMRATAQLGGGSSIPIDDYSRWGKVPVADDTPSIHVSTPQTIDMNKISLKPGDKFDLTFWGRNMRGQSSLQGHGDYHFGFGYYIIGNNGGTYAERLQDAENWFYPANTQQLAAGTSPLGPSDEIVMAHNYFTPIFDEEDGLSSPDYFTMAYAKKQGIYRAAPRPAGRLIEVDPAKAALYFEPRSYTIVPTSFQPYGGYQGTFEITLWALADPPAEYDVSIATVETAPIRALASRGYRLKIINATGEPQDLNHTYSVTYEGDDPMFQGEPDILTDTIRLSYPAGEADVFVLVPTAESVGRSFTVTVTNSVGEVKGQETFQVAEQGDYQLVIYPEGSIIQNKTQVFKVAPEDSNFYRENLLDMTHTYEFTFDGNSPFNGATSGEFEIYTTSFGGFSIPIKPYTGGDTFTLTIKDVLGKIRAQETYTIGYAELEVDVSDVIENVDVYDSNNYWRINHDYYGTYAEVEVRSNGVEVYRQKFTGDQKQQAQRVRSAGSVLRGGPRTGYSYQQNWSIYDGRKPEGFSNATATGGSEIYVDYHWSTSTSEGGLYTTAVMNLLDPFDNDLTNGTKLYIQGRDQKVSGAVTCRVTDSAGNQGTGSGLIRFNQDRQADPVYEEPDPPSLTVTISSNMDSRTTIPRNGGDDGYVEDTVSGSVSGGSGSYSTRWSFTNATAIRVTGLNGSGQINKPTYRLGVSGANGLEALPVGTAGTWRGTLTYTATDNNTGASGSASVGIFFMIEVVQGGISPPGPPPGPPGPSPEFDQV
jgi:hypothetical protein